MTANLSIGMATVTGGFQLSSAGVVALLEANVSGGGGSSSSFGTGITLQVTAEVAINSTSSPVSSIGGVPLTAPDGTTPLTIAADSFSIVASGTLTLDVGGADFVINGVFSTSVVGDTTTITAGGTLTASVDGSTLLTMNANGVLVFTTGGSNRHGGRVDLDFWRIQPLKRKRL